MFFPGFLDRGLKLHPITHCGNFAKRNSSLHHAERTGIHSEEEDFFWTLPVPAQIFLVNTPGILQRMVNVSDGQTAFQLRRVCSQATGRVYELAGLVNSSVLQLVRSL